MQTLEAAPTPKLRRTIATDVFAMWKSFIFTQFLSFALAVYIRTMLGPEMMGVWALIQVFIGYSGYANLGIYDAVLTQIPLSRGQGDFERAKNIENTAFSFTMVTAIIISVLFLMAAFFLRSSISKYLFWGLIGGAFLNILQRWNNFTVGMLYCDKKFVLVSQFRIWSAVMNAVFVVIFVSLFNLYGFFLAMLLSFGFNIFYIWMKTAKLFSWRWEWKELNGLIQLSVILLLVGFLHQVLTTADRLVLGWVGMTELGIYTLATMGAGYVLAFANMFSAVLYPRILEKYGENLNPHEILKFSTLPGRFLSIYLPVFIGVFWTAAPGFTYWLLNKYIAGLPSLKILMFAALMAALVTQMSHVVLARGRAHRMIWVYLPTAAGSLTAYSFLVRDHASLAAFAALAFFSLLVLYVIQNFVALRGIMSSRQIAVYLLKILPPVAGMYGILEIMDRLWEGHQLSDFLYRCVFFGGVTLAYCLLFEKKFHLLDTLKEVWPMVSGRIRTKPALEVPKPLT